METDKYDGRWLISQTDTNGITVETWLVVLWGEVTVETYVNHLLYSNKFLFNILLDGGTE